MPPKGVQMVLSSRFLFFASHLDQGQVRNFPPTFLVPGHQDGANDTPTLTLAPRSVLLARGVVVIYIRICLTGVKKMKWTLALTMCPFQPRKVTSCW